MDEQLDIEFTGKKNTKGEYDPDSISLKSNNPTINKKLGTWTKTRDLVQKTLNVKDEFENETKYQKEVTDMQAKADGIKQHLMDDNMVVATSNIKIKEMQ